MSNNGNKIDNCMCKKPENVIITIHFAFKPLVDNPNEFSQKQL